MKTRKGPGRPSPRVNQGRPRGAEGFTLIEVIVAMVVLTGASLVAFPTLVSFFDLSSAAREENVATHDVQSALEDLMATPFGRITSDYPDGQAIPKYTNLHLTNQQIVVSYADPDADPLVITLVVSWNDHRGRARQEQLSFLRTN